MLEHGATDDAGGCAMPPGAGPDPGGPLIVVAEEQPAIQALLMWMLRLAGYDVAVCAGMQAAFTWKEQNRVPEDLPVVLLVDLSLLCTHEAADFLSRVRARWQSAEGVFPHLIVLTTNPQIQADLGTTENVLLKPFHVRDLLALIRQAGQPLDEERAVENKRDPGERLSLATEQIA